MTKKIIAVVLSSAIAMMLCLGMTNQAITARASSDTEAVEAETQAESITEEDALAIAIKAAGFSESAIRYPKVLDDMHDEAEAYKVIFYVGPVEFAYCIDKAGEIIDRHVKD